MARPKYPSDEVDKTMVRFSAGLMPRLREAAATNRRSMNAEIVARLEGSFTPAEDDAEFDLMRHRLQALKIIARMSEKLMLDVGDEQMAFMSGELHKFLDEDDERERRLASRRGGTPLVTDQETIDAKAAGLEAKELLPYADIGRSKRKPKSD